MTSDAEAKLLEIVSEALENNSYCILPENRTCPFTDHYAPGSDAEDCTGCQYLA